MRDSIFISYSREDRGWLDEFKATVGDLGGEARLHAWDDSRISPAARWRQEIDEALQTAAAAVLLLSPSFFASEFIRAFELPALLGAAERGELTLLPVVISDCEHGVVTGIFQAVNSREFTSPKLAEGTRQNRYCKHETGSALRSPTSAPARAGRRSIWFE